MHSTLEEKIQNLSLKFFFSQNRIKVHLNDKLNMLFK